MRNDMKAKYLIVAWAILLMGLSSSSQAQGYWKLHPETTNGVKREYIRRDSEIQSVFNSVLGTLMTKVRIEVPTNTLRINYEVVLVEDGKPQTSLWKYEYDNQSNASSNWEDTIYFVVKPVSYDDSFHNSTKWTFILVGTRMNVKSSVVHNPLPIEDITEWGYDSEGLYIGSRLKYVSFRITRTPGTWVDNDLQLIKPNLFVDPEK